MGDMPGPDLLSFGPECIPVEASPMSELQIYQYGENSQYSARYQDAFFVHVAGKDPTSLVRRRAQRLTQGK